MTPAVKSPPIGLLMAISLVGPLATHLVVPSLPNLQRHFATDYSTAQLLISLFMISFGAAQIVIGPLADAYGRRRVLIGGLALFCGTSVLCAMATSIEMLIALRVLQGACGCVGIVLGRAIVRDIFTDDQTARMLGYMAMGVAVGPMVAPAVGGLLYESFGWTAPFLFLAFMSGLGGLLAIWFVPETHKRAATRFRLSVLLADFGHLLGHRDFVLCAGAICFNTAMFYCFVIGGPFIGIELLGMTPSSYGLSFSVVAIGYAAGNWIAARLSGRFRPRSIILTGSLTVAVFIAILALVFWLGLATPARMFLIMAIVTFASGLIMPQALAGTLKADPSKAGSASGMIGFTQFAFAAAFSYIGGVAIEGSASAVPLFGVMFANAIFGIVCALLMRRG